MEKHCLLIANTLPVIAPGSSHIVGIISQVIVSEGETSQQSGGASSISPPSATDTLLMARGAEGAMLLVEIISGVNQ